MASSQVFIHLSRPASPYSSLYHDAAKPGLTGYLGSFDVLYTKVLGCQAAQANDHHNHSLVAYSDVQLHYRRILDKGAVFAKHC